MRATIENLIHRLPEPRHPDLRRELELLDRALENHYKTFPEDLALARVSPIRKGWAARRAREMRPTIRFLSVP
jgi:hypothetical protein